MSFAGSQLWSRVAAQLPRSCLRLDLAWDVVRLANRHVSQYSMYGHIEKLAEAEKRGIEKAGGTVDLYQ